MSNKLISPGNVNVLIGLLSVYVIFHNECIMSSREDIKGYSKNNNKGKVETHAQLIVVPLKRFYLTLNKGASF